MPIRVEWDNEEKTTLRHIYEGHWTVKEYYELINENARLIEEAGQVIDIINDLRNTVHMPPDMVPGIRYAINHRHPNEGVNVIVAANTLVRLLVEAVNKTTRLPTSQVLHVSTLEEAHEIIATEKAKRLNTKE